MIKKGNLRKIETKVVDNNIQYNLRLYSILERQEETIDLNALVGQPIKLSYTGNIHCVVTGKKIKKAYGEGMSWDAFESSPMADQSIVKPELSTAHLGIARRDLEWEVEHHVVPHFVYLSFTSDFKVGVTRYTQIPTRWVDQGAVAAVKIAKTPYRQAAGLIEVALKDFIADKTNWRKMLQDQKISKADMLEKRDTLIKHIPKDLEPYILKDESVQCLNYPVEAYPPKITSMKFDKIPVVDKVLKGVKGQYLIFDDNTVMNLRSQSGYEIEFEY